ncbi:MAG: translation initiation factor eIF3 subunit [Tremellales sp. Tagirdzhanova-0007]|nr:MAG: translation initiation factor eIF3 subunit [Tremellales sp. Tagirdzhanova-0007]
MAHKSHRQKALQSQLESQSTVSLVAPNPQLLASTSASMDIPSSSGFAPLPISAQSSVMKNEFRRIAIPPHRMSPLKREWVNLYTPMVEMLGLQVRMNVKRRCVEIKTSAHTVDSGAVQKGADFVKAFALGFDVKDALAILRLDDLYLDSFEVKDVKTLHGDHLSRAIGRIAGEGGKVKFSIENASRTRIVLAETHIHILGSVQNIKIARDAVVSLILGSPPGHERSLNQIIFNAEGDLLFSASKDPVINVWYTSNGERLGTFGGRPGEGGHKGCVWSVACDYQTRYMVSGGADNTMKLWEISSGKLLKSWEFLTAVKRVAWSEDDGTILSLTEQRIGQPSTIRLFAINREDGPAQNETPVKEIVISGSKATVALFGPLSDFILTGHESGKVAKYDIKTGEEVNAVDDAHRGEITDIQLSPDGTYFITSSKDKTARLFDSETLEEMKVYVTETPLNSACIAPLRPYVILGGGQDAMSVTTTSARSGKFESRFWHKLFEEEIGRVRGHFGPINTLAVHPQGRAYASGAEDGFVRVHWFDDAYFRSRPFGDLEPEVES